ncbi:MAG: hypothetical protein R3356_08540, partial [Eudoraea sp.]|nr:hypothetical protein [Eudoraea sp.]
PVSRAVTRNYARLADHHIICAMVADHVKITVIEPLNPIIPDQSLSLLKYLIMYIVTTHSVQNPP